MARPAHDLCAGYPIAPMGTVYLGCVTPALRQALRRERWSNSCTGEAGELRTKSGVTRGLAQIACLSFLRFALERV